jgi:SAM-dependent methyltransferase
VGSQEGDAGRRAREREHFAAIAEAELYWADATPAGRRRRELRAERLLRGAVPGGAARRVLELGCGRGAYSRLVAPALRGRLVAIDLTLPLLRAAGAGAAPNLSLALADATQLPFPDASFDAVWGNAILHHLPVERALRELARVLRPGARLCFAEPNWLNPQVFAERRLPWLRRRLGVSPDEAAFVRWRLRALLASLGLVEVSVEPFDFLYPLTPAFLIGAVERLGPWLERAPVVREIAGSLFVVARKPESPLGVVTPRPRLDAPEVRA